MGAVASLILSEYDSSEANLCVSAREVHSIRSTEIHQSLTAGVILFLSRIFDWNPAWLAESLKNSERHPIVKINELHKMPLMYSSHKEYIDISIPLFALEIWAGITRDYETMIEEKKKKKNKDILYIQSKRNTSRFPDLCEIADMIELELKITISPKAHSNQIHPICGDLVSLEYKTNNRSNGKIITNEVFAYVIVHHEFSITHRYSEEEILLIYTVLTKRVSSPNIGINRLHKLTKISYIRSSVRAIEAIYELPISPLFEFILHPKIENFRLPPANDLSYPLVTKEDLNVKQLEVVDRITTAISERRPKICLIHGPPGTGKSKVIVNLIMQILRGGKVFNKKILVCGPSNAATDEIVKRLLKIRKSAIYGKHYFKIVRVGQIKSMDPKAVKVCLEKEVERELAYRQEEDRSNSKKPRNIGSLETEILHKAEIIASTLSSSLSNCMRTAFPFGGISVCIIDEATQCTEAESIIPLLVGVETLILVGDTKQLPATILSRTAKDLRLDQSLFARLEAVFQSKSDNPIIMLDTQYRMSNPVSQWPNDFFYNGALKNAAIIQELPIQFYKVIDINSQQHREKFVNVGEAHFVVNVVHTLITELKTSDQRITVGIITPYKDQKKIILTMLYHRVRDLPNEMKRKIFFDVNTVDAYQGQERDVIIMSCVRSNGIGFLSDGQRLCVALTRAKHSAIVCGNFKNLRKNRMWNSLMMDAQSRNSYVKINSNAHLDHIKSSVMLPIPLLEENSGEISVSKPKSLPVDESPSNVAEFFRELVEYET